MEKSPIADRGKINDTENLQDLIFQSKCKQFLEDYNILVSRFKIAIMPFLSASEQGIIPIVRLVKVNEDVIVNPTDSVKPSEPLPTVEVSEKEGGPGVG